MMIVMLHSVAAYTECLNLKKKNEISMHDICFNLVQVSRVATKIDAKTHEITQE